MAQLPGPQLDSSVNRGLTPPLSLSGGNVEEPASKIRNVLGTLVDTQPQPFSTVPSGFDANHHYYPGLARSYLAAAVVETPTHRQIQYSTQDIDSVQLTIRGPVSPQVIMRWQLSQAAPGLMLPR